MFIAALFMTVKTWKQSKRPSTEQCVKLRRVCTMDYHSANKMSKIIPYAATWTDLEMIILSEVVRVRQIP